MFYQICQITGQEISEGRGWCPLSEGPQFSIPAAAEDEAPEESFGECSGSPASHSCSRAFPLLLIISVEPWWLFLLGGANLTFIRTIYYNLVPRVL